MMYRNSALQNISGLFQYYGIPQHYGLFYAMGAALVMEGVLSGCYHVCPNHSNFQFGKFFISHFSVASLKTDLSFYCVMSMYVMCVYQINTDK